MQRGFVLQSTYRIEVGKPVVLVYGKLESGQSFLIRDARQLPYFHVRRDDAERARALGALIVEGEDLRKTLRGEPAVRIAAREPREIPPLREKLAANGI